MIEAIRVRRGMTRAELGRRVGRSYKTIYGIERGGDPSARETLVRIAMALHRPDDPVMPDDVMVGPLEEQAAS